MKISERWLDPLVVDDPACITQQRRDLSIAIATMLVGRFNDIIGQLVFVISPFGHLSLR